MKTNKKTKSKRSDSIQIRFLIKASPQFFTLSLSSQTDMVKYLTDLVAATDPETPYTFAARLCLNNKLAIHYYSIGNPDVQCLCNLEGPLFVQVKRKKTTYSGFEKKSGEV